MINNNVYRQTAPALKDNEETTGITDSAGNLKVTLASGQINIPVTLASSGVIPVIIDSTSQFSPVNITTATGTLIKSGTGILHTVAINSAVASGTIKLYNSTVATGTALFATITPIAAPITMTYDDNFTTGLFVQTNSALDITINYR